MSRRDRERIHAPIIRHAALRWQRAAGNCQYPGYIVKALTVYKSGERYHPTMRAIAVSLSEKDMADLAAYYSQQKGLYTKY